MKTWILVVAVVLSALVPASAAEYFGSIAITPQTLAGGPSYHGYREHRFLVENNSSKETHEVTLMFPDTPFLGNGMSIRRISRTVKLQPGTRMVVPLWQPPVRQIGNGLCRIIVDGERVGVVTMPPSSHVTHFTSYGMTPQGTALVARALDFDDLERTLVSHRSMSAASMLTGPPDSRGRRGLVPTAWSPDLSASMPHWLEAEFAGGILADRVLVHDTMGGTYNGTIHVIGRSGTNLHTIAVHPSPVPPGAPREFSFPATSEPVVKIRFEFGSTFAGMISIDAIELRGPVGAGVWADSATASSVGAFSGSAPRPNLQLVRSETGVDDWSESWLSYSAYDAILISQREWDGIRPAVREALQRYAETGGILVLFGGQTVPVTWKHLATSGDVAAGFGRCVLAGAERASDLPPERAKAISSLIEAGGRVWRSTMDEVSANNAFPVVENVRIPVREIVVFMLAFVVIIGPVNIIYLSRKKRRVWLLWTIPAISFVTTLGVFGYSVVREGFTPDVRIESVTYLDQVNHRASTLGLAAYYCPLTPSGGLRFGLDVEVTPQVDQNSVQGSSCDLDWTHGQHLSRGWVSARVPAHFQLRKPETRRERIQLEGDHIVNGLGAGVEELWVADSAGRLQVARAVPAGARAPLEPVSGLGSVQNRDKAFNDFADRFAFRPLEELDPAAVVNYLRPNCFIAVIEGNPFLEVGLGSAAKGGRTRVKSIVYGVMEAPATQ